jgi:activating signal cointegrator 1
MTRSRYALDLPSRCYLVLRRYGALSAADVAREVYGEETKARTDRVRRIMHRMTWKGHAEVDNGTRPLRFRALVPYARLRPTKVLTLTQPWASLIACGAKQVETRSWKTDYRGPILIHAAQGFPAEAKEYARTPEVSRLLGLPHPDLGEDPNLSEVTRTLGLPYPQRLRDPTILLPRGEIVATATLTDILSTDSVLIGLLSDQEISFGDYTTGRWAWYLSDVRPVDPPVPAKGRLGLWEMPWPDK